MEGAPCPQSRNGSPGAFVVLCGRYGDVAEIASGGSNRGNRFTARLVKSPMLSTEPQSSPASTNSSGNSPGSRLEIQDLQERLEHAIEITRDKQDEFASVAQARGSA